MTDKKPTPIHLTGEDADRMTEGEREAVREKIRRARVVEPEQSCADPDCGAPIRAGKQPNHAVGCTVAIEPEQTAEPFGVSEELRPVVEPEHPTCATCGLIVLDPGVVRTAVAGVWCDCADPVAPKAQTPTHCTCEDDERCSGACRYYQEVVESRAPKAQRDGETAMELLHRMAELLRIETTFTGGSVGTSECLAAYDQMFAIEGAQNDA